MGLVWCSCFPVTSYERRYMFFVATMILTSVSVGWTGRDTCVFKCPKCSVMYSHVSACPISLLEVHVQTEYS